jgi:hypothetical protein
MNDLLGGLLLVDVALGTCLSWRKRPVNRRYAPAKWLAYVKRRENG